GGVKKLVSILASTEVITALFLFSLSLFLVAERFSHPSVKFFDQSESAASRILFVVSSVH
ncbi:MAG: hypothetical protein AAFX89_07185, partial [Pseudomonadota bacterium]